MNIDKLLIIIILIIIIFIIIFNHKYEHLTESNDKSTTLDALNNITNLINDDKITSKDLEITNNATINNNIKSKTGNIDNLTSKELNIDKINVNNLNVKDLNVSNNLINKNFTYFYDDKASINFMEYMNNNKILTIDNVEIFGIINNNNKTAIISSYYFTMTPSKETGLGIKEIILKSYNDITLIPDTSKKLPMGNVHYYEHQADNWNGMLDFYGGTHHFVLVNYSNNTYRITEESTTQLHFSSGKKYMKLDSVFFKIK